MKQRFFLYIATLLVIFVFAINYALTQDKQPDVTTEIPPANASATNPAGSPVSVYQPVGAPADPKVDVRWNQYHDYAASTDILKRLAAAHPNRARLQSLGRSFEGREMW